MAGTDTRNYAQMLGITHGMIVQEIGWDEGASEEVRDSVKEFLGADKDKAKAGPADKPQALIHRALEHLKAYERLSGQGDFVAAGKELQELGRILKSGHNTIL